MSEQSRGFLWDLNITFPYLFSERWCMCKSWRVYGGEKTTFRSWFSISTVWAPGNKLKSSGLAASGFPEWAILLLTKFPLNLKLCLLPGHMGHLTLGTRRRSKTSSALIWVTDQIHQQEWLFCFQVFSKKHVELERHRHLLVLSWLEEQ